MSVNLENILVYCSSRNNYEMLENEIFKNVDFEGFDFVNVDDNSCEEQVALGKKVCDKNKVDFLSNKGRGLSMALQTVVDYANNSDKDYKFIFWLSHDCYPITKNMFSKLSSLIDSKSLDDMNMMFNLDQYNSHIKCDDAFHHFCWGDDLGLQFLKSGVYNVTLANFYVFHDQHIKIKYNIPANSFRAAKSGDSYYFCDANRHYGHWEDKWGFDRSWQTQLDTLPESVISTYKGTLLEEFMNHDYTKGPLKTFNF